MGENLANGVKKFLDNQDFEEVKIPVPWGHISAKWWGPKTVQPILAIHGWQDNAGSFDNIAPLLAARGHAILCIDFPGHGLSSHYPTGNFYYLFHDGIHIVRRLVKFFNWRQPINLIGHSMGGAICFLYASTYPDEVDRYASIDIASPLVLNIEKIVSRLGQSVDKFFDYENMKADRQPCHTYDEMIDIVFDAHNGKISRQNCEVMMRRGMREAEGRDKGLYYYNRDLRLKVAFLAHISVDQVFAFASRIKCRVLNIKATNGLEKDIDLPGHYEQVLNEIEKTAKKLERRLVEGTHHIHLNNAEAIIDMMDTFFKEI